MKRIIFLLLFYFPLLSKSQYLIDIKIADTIKNETINTTINNSITKRTTDNHIIYLQNINLTINSIGQVKYDSIIISKYTLDGNTVWQKKYPLTTGGNINDFIETADNGFFLVGEIGINNSIVKLDQNGEFVFVRNYINTDSLLTIRKIVETNDGNYILASYKAVVENGCWMFYEADIIEQSFLTKINPDGNIIWHHFLSENKFRKGSHVYNIFNISDIKFDFLNDAEQTFNILFFTKENFDEPPLKLNLLHYDKNGNRLDSVILKEYPVYNDWFVCMTDFIDDYINITDEGYSIIELVNQDTLQFIKKYYLNKSGIFLDTTIRNIPLNTYIGTSLINLTQLKITAFSELNNEIHILLRGPIMNYYNNFTYFKCDTDLISNLVGSIELKDDSIDFGTCVYLAAMNDSTLLFISEAYKNGTQDSTAFLKFYHISLNTNRINYSIYIDNNNNGIQDVTDATFSNCLIEFNDGNSIQNLQPNDGSYYSTDGTFTKYLLAGTYISKLISYEQSLKYYTVSPVSKTSTFTNNFNGIDSVKFSLLPKPNIQDLQVSIIPTTVARPGFISYYKVIAKNVGTKIMYLPTVKFVKDTLQSFEPTTYNIQEDTLFWEIDSLYLGEQREIIVKVLNAQPPLLNMNDTLHLSAQISPIENDSFIQDNLAILNQLVVTSYDPNDKIETHGGNISLSDIQNQTYLYYTIRFQNTGNSYASRVEITDTLTDNLDASTLEMLSASHPFSYTVKDRKYITWTANIYLPDSTTDETNSHGYISFRIKPKNNLTSVDVITNRANIVFDFNSAISTNTCNTTIIEQRITNIKQNEIKGIKLYPSPTNNIVQLEYDIVKNQDIKLKIMDLQGKELYQQLLKSNTGLNTIQVNLSDYANGVYFIQLNTDSNNLYTGKVLKQ